MSTIDIHSVEHWFGDLHALRGVDLSIAQGEFFSLLGPSGCGKTTLLNIIAGFLNPSAGRVIVGGRDVTDLQPHQRQIGMVFQNYALFPHLNVFDNVAYGLRVRKEKSADIRARVTEMLELVQLASLAQRMPHQLSGGQQQRVAIARALAIRPQVLLLDEPLSNLDAKLRKEMQIELRRMLGSIGVTTVMVTHDQEEALGLSDRIGIVGAGRLQQVGTPLELYRHPANRFVGEFVGHANLFEATPAGQGYVAASRHAIAAGVPLLLAPATPVAATTHAAQSGSLFLLRPERIRLSVDAQPTGGPNTTTGVVQSASYTGAGLNLLIRLAGSGTLQVTTPETQFASVPQAGTPVFLAWDAADLTALPNTGADGLS